MKIKNLKLKINKKVLLRIVGGCIFVGSIAGATVLIYSYNNQHQICQDNKSNWNVFTNEDGEYCCYFESGEHVIQISKNDMYYHKIENVDGYYIDEVIINYAFNNSKVTYVNKEPVIAVATEKNGELEFNDFGTVEKGKSK